MKNLALRVRISVLWLFMAVAMSAHMVLSFFEPGVVELILSGGFAEYQSEEIFVFYALFWLIPLTMAFLSVTLKDSTTRQANIVVGTGLTISNMGHLFFELVTEPSFHMAQASAHQLLINTSTVVATVLIVWYAWKWPKEKK